MVDCWLYLSWLCTPLDEGSHDVFICSLSVVSWRTKWPNKSAASGFGEHPWTSIVAGTCWELAQFQRLPAKLRAAGFHHQFCWLSPDLEAKFQYVHIDMENPTRNVDNFAKKPSDLHIYVNVGLPQGKWQVFDHSSAIFPTRIPTFDFDALDGKHPKSNFLNFLNEKQTV